MLENINDLLKKKQILILTIEFILECWPFGSVSSLFSFNCVDSLSFSISNSRLKRSFLHCSVFSSSLNTSSSLSSSLLSSSLSLSPSSSSNLSFKPTNLSSSSELQSDSDNSASSSKKSLAETTSNSWDWNCPEQKPISCCVDTIASESLNKGDKLFGIDLISLFKSFSFSLFMSSSLLSDNKTNLCFFFLGNSISWSKRFSNLTHYLSKITKNYKLILDNKKLSSSSSSSSPSIALFSSSSSSSIISFSSPIIDSSSFLSPLIDSSSLLSIASSSDDNSLATLELPS
ncbi:hypothetical protein AGLY_015895 [Aphis glycines]|uniref:Uncharacterized protein n=1 Tax=Aphis glycines TaxID=307491 RepID=A0A6G0T196_APHGL|nr:hypothetical protein AGLY_015895 [Aphis glycines]